MGRGGDKDGRDADKGDVDACYRNGDASRSDGDTNNFSVRYGTYCIRVHVQPFQSVGGDIVQ